MILLSIACFDWKIGVFQQTIVRVYYILKLILEMMFVVLDKKVYCW